MDTTFAGSPREAVERALRWEPVRPMPFTIYESKIPQCSAERALRNRGLCIVKRDVPIYQVLRPNVRVTQAVYWEGERQFVRTLYETPVGTLSTLDEPVGFTSWHHERMWKRPEDYAALRFLVQDTVYLPDYDCFAQAERAFGPDGIFRSSFGLEPLQMLISGQMMAMHDFCLEWMDRRDEILALYEMIVESKRKLYPIVAASPVGHANYGGNVVPEIIGREAFRRHYLPHYAEAAEVMHAHGKRIGCHFDGNNRLIADLIGETPLDYIEAFTPAPDTNMSLAEARAAWPDKALWLNYPSSLHLSDDGEVERATVALLDELPSCRGVIMGITEDIPEHRWQSSCRAIMDGLDRHAHEHPERYD
ncbi:MAG: hypothetical protein JXA74_01740 [Anaerolineae bacterium]|nr:hypothetical protein [Anaerolineae bacterium]